MSRHTPGPWKGAEGIVYALSIDGKTNRFIAQVSGGYVHHGARNRTGAEELLANARLIAAAPTLLAACREAVASCRCRGTGKVDLGCRFCGDSTYEHDCEEVMRDCQHCKGLRAAIAAATTEEQGHG